MPIGNTVVYNSGDLILSTVSSSGNTFQENKIAAATSSIILFDSNARINSQSLSSLTVGTASIANNGGVTQLFAGPNITLSPTNGIGQVTVTGTNPGGAYYNTATGSYGNFYDTGSYTIASTTTAYSMSLNTTDISNGVYISGSDLSQIKFTNAGVYNVQFSAQFQNSDSNDNDVQIWVRRNGSDLAATNGLVAIPAKHGVINGHLITGWNWYLTLGINDVLQIMWQAASTGVSLVTYPAGVSPTTPTSPAVIVNATRIDTLLSNTGSFSGSFSGSHFGTSSWATNALTASSLFPTNNYQIANLTASNISASGAITASSIQSSTVGIISSLTVGTSTTINGTLTVNNNISASGNIIASSLTGSHFGTSSWAQSASNAVNSQTSSYLTPGNSYTITNLTASNISASGFISASNGFINGSLYVNGQIVATTFSSSTIYITSSQLIIGDNIITVNAASPAQRYAGISMYDSGSGTLSNLLWDSQNNYMFVSSSDNTASRQIILGPVNEANLTANYIPLISGSNDISSSIIYQNSNNIGIGLTTAVNKLDVAGNISCSVITASLFSGSVSGSIFGTSSWSTNSLTASSLVVGNSYTITNLTASGQIIYKNAVLLDYTTSNMPSTISIVLQNSTGSYNAAFFDYAIFSSSNSRAGTVIATWNSSSIVYTEYCTTDIGNTGAVTMSAALSANNIQLIASGSVTNWNIKAAARYI